MTIMDEVFQSKGNLPFNLHLYLKERGCQGTGTVRENRVPQSCPLPSKKVIERVPRGTYNSIIDRTNGIIYVRWMDNSVVSVASTYVGVQPLGTVRWYSQAQKKFINVSRPHLIGQYNAFMGGVDHMDENIARHRVAIRGKKWWWCLFTWILDVSVHATHGKSIKNAVHQKLNWSFGGK